MTDRRRHPAQGSRILAAGGGLSVMFGLVALMAHDSATTEAAPAAPVAPAPVVVVVHRASPAAAGGATATTPTADVSTAPVPLTAQPRIIRTAPPAPAQPAAASTHGSR